MSSKETKAETLLERAREYSNTGKIKSSLKGYVKLIEDYSETLTVQNYALDDYIMLSASQGNYEDAIWASKRAAELKPEYAEWYLETIPSFELARDGDKIGSVKAAYEAEKPRLWTPGFISFANDFIRAGDRDTAWRVLNEGTTEMFRRGVSPHSIRQRMADMRVEEGNVLDAVEIMIQGLADAHKLNPKGITKTLQKHFASLLKKARIHNTEELQSLLSVVKEKGAVAARAEFRRMTE